MPSKSFTSHLDADKQSAFTWHSRPAALERLLPPWEDVRIVSHEGVHKDGSARLTIKIGPFSVRMKARHTEVVDGSHFKDELERGPFKRWSHVHRFAEDDDGSRLRDEIEYQLPAILRPIADKHVRKRIGRQFAYRHRTTRSDLHLHRKYGRGTLKIALSGSRKLVGTHLVSFLEAGGHEVLRIVPESPDDPAREIQWNHRENILERDKLEGLDAVIHLGGEHLLSLGRWSEQKKMEIISNRVRGTEHLARAIARLDDPPKAFLSASAIAYYGDRDEEVLEEFSAPGDDIFLSAVCQDWERATHLAAEAGIRTVQMRLGVVMTPTGGVLRSLLVPFRLGLGGRYGGRNQYLSWIGIDDVLGAVYHLLSDESIDGPVNVTSPNPVTMSEFARTLGKVVSRPVFLNMPPWLLRALLGKISDDAALMSVRAIPKRLIEGGYEFLRPDLEGLLRHVLGRTSEPFDDEVVQGIDEKVEAA